MRSIRRRLAVQLSIAIAVLFLAAGTAVSLFMKEALYDRLDAGLTARARALEDATEVDDDEFELDSSTLDPAGSGPGRDFHQIRRISGGPPLVGSDARTLPGSLPIPPEDGTPLMADSTLDGKPARFFLKRFRPENDGDRLFQDLYVVTGAPLGELQDQLGLLHTIILAAGAAAILATVFIVGSGVTRGLSPLGRLSEDLRGIRADQLDQRLETSHLPAELMPVGESLNAWLQRLEESFDRERRFSSHAAHELRTPLAELRAMAELGAMFPEEATQEKFREMLAVSEELSVLLERLSLLARAEAGRQPASRAPVDLEAAVATALGRLSAKAEERGIRFDKTIDPAPFESDPVLWGTLLQNLAGNAVSHAPAGSLVTITAGPGTITVTNPAPDLSREDLDRMFEKFWRKDAAHTGSEHSGLGLSIVQAIARMLGGGCSATISPDQMLTITVTAPGGP